MCGKSTTMHRDDDSEFVLNKPICVDYASFSGLTYLSDRRNEEVMRGGVDAKDTGL